MTGWNDWDGKAGDIDDLSKRCSDCIPPLQEEEIGKIGTANCERCTSRGLSSMKFGTSSKKMENRPRERRAAANSIAIVARCEIAASLARAAVRLMASFCFGRSRRLLFRDEKGDRHRAAMRVGGTVFPEPGASPLFKTPPLVLDFALDFATMHGVA